jgi:hypothetical protein
MGLIDLVKLVWRITWTSMDGVWFGASGVFAADDCIHSSHSALDEVSRNERREQTEARRLEGASNLVVAKPHLVSRLHRPNVGSLLHR